MRCPKKIRKLCDGRVPWGWKRFGGKFMSEVPLQVDRSQHAISSEQRRFVIGLLLP